MKIFQHRHFQ